MYGRADLSLRHGTKVNAFKVTSLAVSKGEKERDGGFPFYLFAAHCNYHIKSVVNHCMRIYIFTQAAQLTQFMQLPWAETGAGAEGDAAVLAAARAILSPNICSERKAK